MSDERRTSNPQANTELDAVAELLRAIPTEPLLYELWTPGGTMLAWLHRRPAYCDRGRFHAGVETVRWQSECDPWPRYYFDLDNAKEEVEAYLRAKRVDVAGATWRAA